MRYIIGAGGHARVVWDICQQASIQVNGFIADDAKEELRGLPCYRSADKTTPADDVIIAIGSNQVRQRMASAWHGGFFTAVHPRAVIDTTATIGTGSMVSANAVINADARIGRHVIINTGAVVEHDCIIADYAHISPNATLCGNVKVGEATHIGAGATVIPGITIGRNAVIGAGAVIIKDVPDDATVVGNPGRMVKNGHN